jgi:hypothetical protein
MKKFTVNLMVAMSTLVLGACMSTSAFGGGDRWKEEVLLHDGQKIIVERSQSYGGRSEPGQAGPIKEHSISFMLPGTSKTITWTSEYGEDLGRTNFNLLAVHVLNGTPYIVASPNLCLSYNKWGRPNPPYVFFKYDGNAWQRIPLEQFPAEFKTINVAHNTLGRDAEILVGLGFVPTEKIKEMNRSSAPELKSILREAIQKGTKEAAWSDVNCEEMIRVKDGWVSPGGAKAPIPITPRTPSDVNK